MRAAARSATATPRYHDYETDAVYVPLAHLVPGLANFEVYNSPLSEYAVVGFEFGYSVADPLQPGRCGKRSMAISSTARRS